MGKKKDKLLAAQQHQQQQQPVPWKEVDSDPVGFLVAPEDRHTFFGKYWEKQPAVFKATPGREALFHGMCSLPTILNWLKQREKKAGPLEFGVDINAARYKDGTRTTPNGEVADAATLQELHNKEDCTLQLHQPQRFFDPCWRLLAALERQLGCLVGTNAYLTPAGSQGLAPHYDDVELWVVQTSGRKRWRLYDNVNGYMLPNASSPDFDQASLGKPCMEVELAVGDCLYMPRGTVHQAEAVEGVDSSHLTISTYQRCSFADLATHVLQVGLSVQDEEPRSLPLAARFSPAPGTLQKHSLHHVLAQDSPAVSTTPEAVSGLAGALRAIADKLEGPQGAGMLTAAVHASAIEFLMNRLPPHPKQLAGKGRAPTLDDKVWCRVAGWGYLLPFEMTGMVCEDDDSNANLEEGLLKLCTCLANSREEHMIMQPDESDDDDDDEGATSGSEGDSDSGSEHDSGDSKGAAANGSEPEGADEAIGRDAEGAGSHGGDDRHTHKDNKKGRQHAKKSRDDSDDGSEGQVCEGDACGQGHSLGSGAGGRARDPVSALPGLVFEPRVAKSVVSFMLADSPDKAIAVRDLGLSSDAASLQFAFALWAEDLAATVPSAAHGSGKQDVKKEGKAGKRQLASEPAAADGEQVATSSGKPAKKSKA